jgi:glycerophosphoryl diester phosphodiesterase
MFDILPSRSGRILVCGHRGHSIDGHENTRPALQRARELGASLCEIDLRMTRDGRLIVYHDDILDNASTGTGLISQMNYAGIARLQTKNRNGLSVGEQPIRGDGRDEHGLSAVHARHSRKSPRRRGVRQSLRPSTTALCLETFLRL